MPAPACITHTTNLGVACRVDKHSIESLQKASFKAQKQAESFPIHLGIAPASKGKSLTRSLSEPTPLRHLAFEESTRQQLQQQVPPPTQLWHVVSQLKAELCTLQNVVRQLAMLQSVAFSKKEDNLQAELGEEEGARKTTTTTTTITTTTTTTTTTTMTTTQTSKSLA